MEIFLDLTQDFVVYYELICVNKCFWISMVPVFEEMSCPWTKKN